MGNEVNEHEFDDIAEFIQDERENAAPRYCSLPESIFGEMQRMSETKMKQISEQEGGQEWD